MRRGAGGGTCHGEYGRPTRPSGPCVPPLSLALASREAAAFLAAAAELAPRPQTSHALSLPPPAGAAGALYRAGADADDAGAKVRLARWYVEERARVGGRENGGEATPPRSASPPLACREEREGGGGRQRRPRPCLPWLVRRCLLHRRYVAAPARAPPGPDRSFTRHATIARVPAPGRLRGHPVSRACIRTARPPLRFPPGPGSGFEALRAQKSRNSDESVLLRPCRPARPGRPRSRSVGPAAAAFNLRGPPPCGQAGSGCGCGRGPGRVCGPPGTGTRCAGL